MRNLFLALAAASTLVSLPAAAATATFSDKSFNLVGSASMQGSDLQLTAATPSVSGGAWQTTLYSSSQSFSATFGFSLSTNTNYLADGIAFVLQDKGLSALGYSGSSLGYSGINNGLNGSLNGVGSLIQTWDNNNIGLNTDGMSTGGSTKDAPSGLTLKTADKVTGTETVTYNVATHTLSMSGTLFVTDTDKHGKVGTSEFAVSDSTFIDLSQKFTHGFYLGFTGATGSVVADQRITSFSVTAVPEPETYAMLLAGLGLMGAVARRRKARQA